MQDTLSCSSNHQSSSLPDEELEPTRIESLCLSCGKNGITTILLTKIPFYKDVIVMSFECQYCGYRNNEIQSSTKIPDKGKRYELLVQNEADLNRTVVRSDYTSIMLPHLEFEIPAGSQKGDVTTIESIIDRMILGLSQEQEERRQVSPDVAEKIDKLIAELYNMKNIKQPFKMIFEDIKGDCFISSLNAPFQDPYMTCTLFSRTIDQDHTLGIYTSDEVTDEPSDKGQPDALTEENLRDEVLHLPGNCPSCNAPCPVNMKIQEIPYFKEVVIMATNCDACGYRSNEVKPGAGTEPKGIKIIIKVQDSEDLCRDILKSDTCEVMIPELELEIGAATMGGRFTTLEGLLVNIKDNISSSPYMFGDSADPNIQDRVDKLIRELERFITVSAGPFTVILDDPAGNSYVQSKTPPNPDDQLSVEYYERSFQQNEDLGLNDMKVENYEEK